MSSPEPKQSYLAAGLGGISNLSPWGSRSSTPRPPLDRKGAASGKESDVGGKGLGEEGKEGDFGGKGPRGGDHTLSHRHRLSQRDYPKDCPGLGVQWYHATDIPKRKPLPSGEYTSTDKPAPIPKKWVTFSKKDSKAIEAAYQRLVDEEDAGKVAKEVSKGADLGQHNTAFEGAKEKDGIRVPVNEDYLFDVDVEKRELGPAYWLGPIYEVRRGTWFYSENPLRPCDENLATQLEEGYLKVKPWQLSQPETPTTPKRSASVSKPRPSSAILERLDEKTLRPKSSMDSLRSPPGSPNPLEKIKAEENPSSTAENRTFRLFGAHMSSVVTYENADTAWLLTDDFLSRMSSTMYARFAGGSYYAGTKLVRGYTEPKKAETKDPKGATTPTKSNEGAADSKDKDEKKDEKKDEAQAAKEAALSAGQAARRTLERQISSLVMSTQRDNPLNQEESVRKREEQEMEEDYKEQEGDEQDREIEHLILVTHGIGQRLGLRMESVNFVHDVNTLRKSLKAVYADSPDLQALNGEVDKMPKNSRVQVLPICWRHLLDFPKQSLKHNRKEFDLADIDEEEEDYPNLDDITVEGVPAVRNLITDLALDILLYQSPAYKGHITRIVLQECNRIYKLFKERNPNFNGKISLLGHSLGSAIMFDILCRQKSDKDTRRHRHSNRRNNLDKLQLQFEVEDFYALGSPIGLFQMLKGRTIAARQLPSTIPALTPFDTMDFDPFQEEPQTNKKSGLVEITTSSPKCQRIFNIFHPTDPISYRLEPLITPAMSALKPQPLPYTKKGIFGAPVGEGLAGISARVGQSVSGLWTSFSTGIASSLLNRSLGLTGEDASKLSNPLPSTQPRPSLIGAGTNVSGGVIPSAPLSEEELQAARDSHMRRMSEANVADLQDGEHPPTLIDTEMETLFSGFQKRRKSQNDADKKSGVLGTGSDEWEEMEEQSRRLRREEAKVRALNENGRVDYSIQEGAFDISLLASIASHLSYWADEDVSHFIISQLLARHRVLKKPAEARQVGW